MVGTVLRSAPELRTVLTRGPRAHSVRAVQLRLDRDSVHAGDDAVSHATVIEVEPWRKLRAVITDVVSTRHYLASIIGGEATWIVEGAPEHRPPRRRGPAVG